MLWKGFQKPKRLAVNSDSLNEKYGSFSAQPFERGFGTTIGNSLRRALLSSIEGAAITAVRIEGVSHEFSSIPGVVEDASDIILNLKQIPLQLHGEGARTIRLRVTEPGDVASGAIEADSGVVILDPNVHIATINDEAVLDIEMRVRMGRGYVSAEKNYEEDLAVDFIPIDSVHSPVHRVKYGVEQARLGQTTDFEKLNLELWTNGAVTPQDAIGLAAKLLKDHMQIFINFEEDGALEDVLPEAEGDLTAEHFNKSIEDLELSVRSFNCLKNANIQTIGDLVVRTESDMMRVKNFGRKSLLEISDILHSMGLEFGMLQDERGRLVPRQSSEG
ncbi:MAG: DNA-directed RNA polymerase subunit alpha [Acidobacteriia bacterium]|nr:DNA-directed RNA polymerase subunit alpha [Terriglobia bacterium]MYC66663.1 DNA-directed RNA polymerase subunit alpha [Terriglobia bacterium]